MEHQDPAGEKCPSHLHSISPTMGENLDTQSRKRNDGLNQHPRPPCPEEKHELGPTQDDSKSAIESTKRMTLEEEKDKEDWHLANFCSPGHNLFLAGDTAKTISESLTTSPCASSSASPALIYPKPSPYTQFTIEAQPFLRPNGKQGYKIASIYESQDNKSPTKIPAPLMIRKVSNRGVTQVVGSSEHPFLENMDITPFYRALSLRSSHSPTASGFDERASTIENAPAEVSPSTPENIQAPGRKYFTTLPSPPATYSVDYTPSATEEVIQELPAEYKWAVSRPVLTIEQRRLEYQIRVIEARRQAEAEALRMASEEMLERQAGAIAWNAKNGRRKVPNGGFKAPSSANAKVVGEGKGKQVSPTGATASGLSSGDEVSPTAIHNASQQQRAATLPKALGLDAKCPIMGTQLIRSFPGPNEIPGSHESQAAAMKGNPGNESLAEHSGSSEGDSVKGSPTSDTGFGHYAVRSRKNYNVPKSPQYPAPSSSKQLSSGFGCLGNTPNSFTSVSHTIFPDGERGNTAGPNDTSGGGKGNTEDVSVDPAPLTGEDTNFTNEQIARQYEYLQRERIRQDAFRRNPAIFSDVKKLEEQRKAMMARQKGMAKCIGCERWREPGTKCCDMRVKYRDDGSF